MMVIELLGALIVKDKRKNKIQKSNKSFRKLTDILSLLPLKITGLALKHNQKK